MLKVEKLNENQKMKNKKVQTKNKGITLIALVITIIVILILAGVSINTLFGDNGLLTKADEAKEGEQYSVPAGSRFGSPYENAKLITPEAPEAEGISLSDTGAFVPKDGGAAGFPTSWKYDGEGTDPLKFTVNANAVFVIYKRNNSSSFGSVDVYLNGEKLKTVDTNQSDGWGEAFSEQIIKYQGVKELEMELRPTEGSKGKQIDILGIAYSQNVTF